MGRSVSGVSEESRTGYSTAIGQLESMLGQEKAQTLVRECLKDANLEDVKTAQDLLNFAMHLARRGGIVEIIGRSLKVQALIRGAHMD